MATQARKSPDHLVPVRLTKAQVERLHTPTQGQRFLRDSELKGFLVRVTSGGAKTFCLDKRIKGRKFRRKIGSYPDMSVDRARKIANIWLGQIAEGKNPFEEDDDQARDKLTINTVLVDYLKARKGLQPRTITDYKQIRDKAFRDWKNRPLTCITKAMVQQRHSWLGRKSGPYYANGAMQLLRALFNYAVAVYDDAEGQPLIQVNPVMVLTTTRAWFPEEAPSHRDYASAASRLVQGGPRPENATEKPQEAGAGIGPGGSPGLGLLIAGAFYRPAAPRGRKPSI